MWTLVRIRRSSRDAPSEHRTVFCFGSIAAASRVVNNYFQVCRNSMIMSSCELDDNVLSLGVQNEEGSDERTFVDEQARTVAQVGV